MDRAMIAASLIVGGLLASGGCAGYSAKITASPRAGSEQLLLTGTADRAIDCLDFGPITGARVFLDDSRVEAADKGWITFALRRAMARRGLTVVDSKAEAQVIVEAAVAAYGTDEVDSRLVLPSLTTFAGVPIAAPSTTNAISRRSRQDAVVKLALVAFDAPTRRLVWESGTVLRTAASDRQFVGSREVERSTSVPELQTYPRR